MKHKVKTVLDGHERELEVDIDPTTLDLKSIGWMQPDEISQRFVAKDAVEQLVKDRLAQFARGHVKLDDIPTNAQLKQQVLDLLGVKVTPDGKPQLTADQVAGLQDDWRKKELAPAVQRAEAAETRTKSLLNRIRNAEIVQAAAEAKVREHFLRPVAEGQSPPIVSILGDLFGYSEEHDRFFVRKGDSFDFSGDPKTTGSPYKGVREFVVNWAREKANEPFIDAGKPGASKAGAPGSDGRPAVLELTDPMQPVDFRQYQQAQEAGGGRVIVKGAEVP